MDFWAFTISISIKFVLSPYFVRAGSNVLKLALIIKYFSKTFPLSNITSCSDPNIFLPDLKKEFVVSSQINNGNGQIDVNFMLQTEANLWQVEFYFFLYDPVQDQIITSVSANDAVRWYTDNDTESLGEIINVSRKINNNEYSTQELRNIIDQYQIIVCYYDRWIKENINLGPELTNMLLSTLAKKALIDAYACIGITSSLASLSAISAIVGVIPLAVAAADIIGSTTMYYAALNVLNSAKNKMPPDTLSPVISSIELRDANNNLIQNGGRVSGVVDISAHVSDDTGISKVAFYAAGQLITELPFDPVRSSLVAATDWNTALGGISGNATVEVVAYDAAGNLGKKTFTV